MQIKIVALLFALFSFHPGWDNNPDLDHAIYLSLVEIDHKNLGNTATVKIKVFADDIEDAIMNASNRRIDFLDPSNCQSSRPEVEAYFEEHFDYSINGKKVVLTLTNCEVNGDAIWFYFKIDCPGKWTKVDVKADFLMELFPTQSNIITISHGDEKRFLKITNSHLKDAVTF